MKAPPGLPLRPRRVPRQARARATHDAIVEAAAHIVTRGGLAAFNTNAVALRAGVSIGSLYQYFPNKDALMAALIERQQKAQLGNLANAMKLVQGITDPVVVVRTMVRAAMQHHRDNALLATAIDHEEARLPIDHIVSEYLDLGGSLVSSMLSQFADQIGTVDPDDAARTLPALVRAVTDSWANLDPPQLDRAEDEAVRAVIGYLGITQS